MKILNVLLVLLLLSGPALALTECEIENALDKAEAVTDAKFNIESYKAKLHQLKETIMSKEQIENNFQYHAPKEGQPEKYAALRAMGKELAHAINDYCPDSREKALALTKLEESVMWANASIARNG